MWWREVSNRGQRAERPAGGDYRCTRLARAAQTVQSGCAGLIVRSTTYLLKPCFQLPTYISWLLCTIGHDGPSQIRPWCPDQGPSARRCIMMDDHRWSRTCRTFTNFLWCLSEKPTQRRLHQSSPIMGNYRSAPIVKVMCQVDPHPV